MKLGIVVLIVYFVFLIVPVSADINVSGNLTRGSAEQGEKLIGKKAVSVVDWFFDLMTYVLYTVAGIFIIYEGIKVVVARKRHNSSGESEGIDSIFSILVVCGVVRVVLYLVDVLFRSFWT